MDKKLLLLFISLLLAAPAVRAQNILDLIDLPEEKATTPAVQALSTHQQTNQPPAVPDTVYCTSTMKRHGWQEPFHIISKEDARHINSVIRLTQPDKNGHYHKMELIDAYGRYAPNNNLSPYILKLWSADTDQSANQEWVKRLKTQCIVETVSDAQDRVVQERAYDKDHNIIFTYSRTPIGKDAHGHERYVGTYRDCYGLPAEMRNDSLSTYGTLVLLTEDRCGYDSIVQYIDAKGYLKLNADSVALEVHENDDHGRILRLYSCDREGRKMRDNWGNCGNEYAWNNNNLISYAVYTDENWQPMRMPLNRRTDDQGSAGIMRVNYQYDNYGRITKVWYTLADGDSCITNAWGVHQIAYEYDDRGNETRVMHYDNHGALTAHAKFGLAIVENQYDEQGRLTNRTFYDEHRQLLCKPSSLCRRHYEYDEEGRQTLEEEYIMRNGQETLGYRWIKTAEREEVTWVDGSRRVWIYDTQGRETLYEYYNAERPETAWKRETEFRDLGEGHCIGIEQFHDKNNNPLAFNDGIHMVVLEHDSINGTNLRKKYDTEGNLIEIFRQQWNKNLVQLLAQQDVNAFGAVCRAGGSAGTLVYSTDVWLTPKGEIGSFVGRDEFGEPDYISADDGVYYYTKRGRRYDVNNRPIDGNERNRLPKVMSIEITDSTAYSLDLKDNDVILSWGLYGADLTKEMSQVDFRTKWAIHSVVEANEERDMVVFRVNPDTKEFGLVRINALKGTPSQQGFNVHERFLTQRQLERINQVIEDDNNTPIPLLNKSQLNQGMFTYSGPNKVVVCYPELYRNNLLQPYPRQCRDASVLLIWSTPEWGDEWANEKSYDGNLSRMVTNRELEAETYPTTTIKYTRDLKTVEELTYNARDPYCILYEGLGVNNNIYKKLLTLTKKAKKHQP